MVAVLPHTLHLAIASRNGLGTVIVLDCVAPVTGLGHGVSGESPSFEPFKFGAFPTGLRAVS